MPAVCRYCGEEIGFLYLLYHRIRHGRLPECEGCGADDDTLNLTGKMAKAETWVCDKCGTKCEYAPGIGHYCPNQDCSVGDGPEITRVK